MADQSERRGFTPGPWRKDSDVLVSVGHRVCVQIGASSIVVSQPGKSRAQNEANGDLIAAAPDLYEALRRLYQNDPMDGGKMTAAAAALAKADGREGGEHE